MVRLGKTVLHAEQIKSQHKGACNTGSGEESYGTEKKAHKPHSSQKTENIHGENRHAEKIKDKYRMPKNFGNFGPLRKIRAEVKAKNNPEEQKPAYPQVLGSVLFKEKDGKSGIQPSIHLQPVRTQRSKPAQLLE